jgi:hypothetical protein
MKKEFIPYEQALALKELGFDEECVSFYSSKGELYQSEGYYKFGKNVFGEEVIAPLYQQAFRWFREKYYLFGQVNIHTYFIYNISNDELKMIKQYDKLTKTHEEAELECLKKLIEIVKQPKK